MLVEFWEAPPFWTLLINALNFYKKRVHLNKEHHGTGKTIIWCLDEHILAIGCF